MRIIEKLYNLVSMVVMFLLGILLLSWSLTTINTGQIKAKLDSLYGTYIYKDIIDGRILVGIIGGLIVILTAWIILSLVKSLGREPSIAFQSDEGEIRVTFKAIEDYVRKVGERIVEVRELRPKVTTARRGVSIMCKVILEPNSNIPIVTGDIQESTRRQLQEVLGIRDIASIKVFVTKILHEKSTGKARKLLGKEQSKEETKEETSTFNRY